MADLSYPTALAGTLAVEVGLYASLLPRLVPAGTSLTAGRAAVVGVLVNVVSHPLLWFVLQPALDRTGATTVVVVLVAESAVWLLEAGLVRALTPVRWPPALAVAALANLVSLAVGLALGAP